MPSWLSTSLSSNLELTPASVAALFWRCGAALALGWAVVGLYRWAKRGESVSPTFSATLILLAALMSMATQVIGDNLARAFGLVGALSVVRFRTVVKDTQDTAFVILAVVVGMSAGVSHMAVGLVGLLLMAIMAPLLWPPGRLDGWQSEEAVLRLKVEGSESARSAVENVFQSGLTRHRLLSASTSKKGAALELTYSVRLRPGTLPIDLVGELNRVEGVTSVDLAKE